MLAILSPAKTLDFESRAITDKSSIPVFQDKAAKLAHELQHCTISEIEKLMSVSYKIAALNYERFQMWDSPSNIQKQAVLAYAGDVYEGLNAATLSEKQLIDSQKIIRIISGLYGVLRPLDLIRPYRLEMSIPLKIAGAANLYQFWGSLITGEINKAVEESGSNILLNLASNEYFKSIDPKKLKGDLINTEFKDLKNGSYKIISFYAKRARGLMARFIIENRITDTEDLKAFDTEGYRFSPNLSKENNLVYIRDH